MPTLAQLEVFFLIFARIAGLFIRTPVLSGRGMPVLARASLAIFLTFILWFVVPLPLRLPTSFLAFGLALVNEVILGFLIGFISYLIIATFQAAGEIMDLQMGLSVSKTLDPAFGVEISIIGRLTYMLGGVLFLVVNGHHLIFAAINTSFSLFPVATPLNYSLGFINELVKVLSELWVVAIQLSAPVILMIFLSDFSFGLISRVAPQVNVFMLGFQVKPLIGAFVFLAVLPAFVSRATVLINQFLPKILTIFGFLRF